MVISTIEAESNEKVLPTQLQLGERTILRVTKLLPFGLAGELPDGSRGIVREREISWDEAVSRLWREQFMIGHTYKVKVLSRRPDHWELSLRLAQRDPWVHVTKRYQVGALVEGSITRFWDQVALIELEPGVTASLSQDELPSWVTQTMDEVFWIGDRVRAHIRAIHIERREIELSTKNLLDGRWSHLADRTDNVAVPASMAPIGLRVPTPGISEPLAPPRQWRAYLILVIEDDPQQNAAIRDWLKKAGHTVHGALKAQEGLQLLQQQPFDYLLCDIGLPDQDGIRVMQSALATNSRLHGILMTDWATADERRREITPLEAQGATLLLKPILPEELSSQLFNPTKSASQRPSEQLQDQPRSLVTPATEYSTRSFKRDLPQLLYNLRYQTRARKVVLFQFDPQNRTIQVTGQNGSLRLDNDALPKLIYSPVRDVAEDGETIHVDDTTNDEAYVRYLTPLLHFRSCVGVPVIVSQHQRFALLLFHTLPDFTGSVIQQEADAAALQIRALVEQQLFIERAAEMQRTVLLGHLSRALIHETNHQLNPILFGLSDLERQCRQVQKAVEVGASQVAEEVREAHKIVNQLTDSVHKLVRITRMFGRVTVQDKEEVVRVERAAEQCLDLVKDLADREHVRLHFHAPVSTLPTRTKLIQVQQVLLNLLLNAVQQIHLSRPQGGGHVHLSFLLVPSHDSVDMIQVLVEDDGPGIHQRLWPRIFELGMTTRQGEGSGMGLFIAQRLIENAGGRLFVGESLPLWGTRMVAEFPIYKAT